MGVKISEMQPAGELTGGEEFEIIRDGENLRASVSSFAPAGDLQKAQTVIDKLTESDAAADTGAGLIPYSESIDYPAGSAGAAIKSAASVASSASSGSEQALSVAESANDKFDLLTGIPAVNTGAGIIPFSSSVAYPAGSLGEYILSQSSSDDELRAELANGTSYLVDSKVVDYNGGQLSDYISLLAKKGDGPIFNAKHNGVDCTGATDGAPALNQLLSEVPVGSIVLIPGTVRTNSPILIPKEGITLRGVNRRGCAIRSYGAGAIIQSATQNATTCKFTVISDLLLLRDSSATGSGYLLDLKSMQFSTCERLWIVGAGVAGQIGVRMEAQATADHIAAGVATEGSYNYLRDCVIGGVTDCVSIRNIANSNTLENVRCQPSITGGYGIRIVADVASGAYVNNIRIISCSCEYPGKITSGVYVGANVSGVTILGTRFESMNLGVYIDAAAGDVWVPLRGNYFSSCNTDIRNEGGDTHKGSVALLRFNVASGAITIARKSGVASVAYTGVGVYTVTFNRDLGVDYVPNVTSSNPQTEVVSLAGKTMQIRTRNSAGVLTDAAFVMLMVEG